MNAETLRSMLAARPAAGEHAVDPYRYVLWRGVARDLPPMVYIATNPSTADAVDGDPTSRRFAGFARALAGLYDTRGYVVVNCFALRSPEPAVLRTHRDPVGPENDAWIRAALRLGGPVVAGWGVAGEWFGRAVAVVNMARALGVELLALRVTPGGTPEHPLYLPGNLVPVPLLARRGGGR